MQRHMEPIKKQDWTRKQIRMEPFELYAIRYAQLGMRKAYQNVIGGDLHEDHSALDYYVWVAKRSDRTFLIDTGMSEETAKRRGETLLRLPSEAIKLLGLDPLTVEDVILTHLHYDHAGTLDHFPKARFYVQDTEMSYATGRCMCTKILKRGYEVEDVVRLVRCVHAGRVQFADETVEITSGLSLHRTGGHTGGSQIVRVWTERGWVVLASDSSHLYCNVTDNSLFPSLYRVDEMMEGFRTIHRLAGGSWDHVIPGHDPLVMAAYPAPSKELEGIVARLDKPPVVQPWK
jgi:glyoxylase-like metal-dependent hydrolase (beta-lactamase superfamily II)